MQTARYARGLRFLPIVAFITTVGLISAVTSYQASAQNVYTTPVGFYQIPIAAGPSAYSAVGVPLQNLQFDRGIISAVTSNTLTFACQNCGVTNYGSIDAAGDPGFYVEFPESQALPSGVGRYFPVKSSDGSGDLVLSVGDDNLTALLSGGSVQVGDTVAVVPFLHLRDLFGPPSACVLTATSKQGTADNVLVYVNGGFVPAFPNSGAGVWYVNSTPDDNFPIYPDEALFVLRRSGGATNGLAIGSVRTTNTTTVLNGGGSYNWVSLSFPAGTTLDNCGLTNSGTGFHGGTKQGNATTDNLLLYVNGGFVPAFYNTTANSWYVNSTPTNGYPLAASQGFFVLLKTTSGFWNKSLPYSP